jgi:hypothetical protein
MARVKLENWGKEKNEDGKTKQRRGRYTILVSRSA